MESDAATMQLKLNAIVDKILKTSDREFMTDYEKEQRYLSVPVPEPTSIAHYDNSTEETQHRMIHQHLLKLYYLRRKEYYEYPVPCPNNIFEFNKLDETEKIRIIKQHPKFIPQITELTTSIYTHDYNKLINLKKLNCCGFTKFAEPTGIYYFNHETVSRYLLTLNGPITFTNLPNLEELDISFNNIDITIGNLPKLKRLIVDGSKIKNIYNCPNLEYFCGHYSLINELSNFPKLKEITANYSTINIISNLPKLKKITCVECYNLKNVSKLPKLEELDCSCGIIKNICQFKSLKILKCSSVELDEDIHDLPKLEKLVCRASNVTKIYNLINLKYLDCYLSEVISIYNMPNLTHLKCSCCQELINLIYMPRLEKLDCSLCYILERIESPKLNKLICNGTPINRNTFTKYFKLSDYEMSTGVNTVITNVKAFIKKEIIKLLLEYNIKIIYVKFD